MRGEVVVLAELVQVSYLEGPLAQDEVRVYLGHRLHGVGQLVVGEADHRLEVPQDATDAGESDVDAIVDSDPGPQFNTLKYITKSLLKKLTKVLFEKELSDFLLCSLTRTS